MMYDPSSTVRLAAKRLSLGFRKVVGRYDDVITDPTAAMDAMVDAMDGTGGIAVGEQHGVYGHADFMTDFIPRAARKGADRLYIEMFSARNQKHLDDWQDRGDADGLFWLMNVSPALSEHMWLHFWQVLCTAREYGLRVVTVESNDDPQLYPGLQYLYRNMKWQDGIEADQKAKPHERPYLLYCGRGHLSRRVCNSTPIHEMLKVAGVSMNDGEFAMMRPRAAVKPAYLAVPIAEDQTPLTMPRRYTLSSVTLKGMRPS